MIHGVILIGLALSSLAQAAPSPLKRAAEAYEHPSLHELSWIGRRIAEAMSDSPFKLDEKTTFLYNNPTRAIVIRSATCEAWALAATLCASDESDPRDTLVVHHDEADAVRHFTLAAQLTCSQGSRVTEIFLAANEGHPSKWAPTNEMDIHNNYQGIFWATDRGNCRPIGLHQRVSQAALEKLNNGHLIILKRGKSRCSSAGDGFAVSRLTRFGEFRAALRRIDARCGGKTVTSP